MGQIRVAPYGTSDDNTKVVVTGLRHHTIGELKEYFSACGGVAYVEPGRGELRYRSREDAVKAVGELTGKTVDGFPITVLANAKDPKKVFVYGLRPSCGFGKLKDF